MDGPVKGQFEGPAIEGAVRAWLAIPYSSRSGEGTHRTAVLVDMLARLRPAALN